MDIFFGGGAKKTDENHQLFFFFRKKRGEESISTPFWGAGIPRFFLTTAVVKR